MDLLLEWTTLGSVRKWTIKKMKMVPWVKKTMQIYAMKNILVKTETLLQSTDK